MFGDIPIMRQLVSDNVLSSSGRLVHDPIASNELLYSDGEDKE